MYEIEMPNDQKELFAVLDFYLTALKLDAVILNRLKKEEDDATTAPDIYIISEKIEDVEGRMIQTVADCNRILDKIKKIR